MNTLLVVGVLAALAIYGMAIITAASWYDIRAARWQRQFVAHPGARRFRKRPFITIILDSHGDISATERSLTSLMKMSYRKYEIIVIGAKKSDFASLRFRKSIMFLNGHRSAEAGRGDLYVHIDAGTTARSSLLTNVAWHFNNRPDTKGLIITSQPTFYPSLAHLLYTYRLLIASLLNRFEDILRHINTESANVIVWRRRVNHKSIRSQLIYADDITVTPLPVQKYSKLFKTQQLMNPQNHLFDVLMITLWTIIFYAFYIAITNHQTALLGLIIFGATLFILAAIWWNNHLTMVQQLLYSALLPVTIGYCYLLLTSTVLKIFTNMTKAIVPISVSLFMRIKNVLGII